MDSSIPDVITMLFIVAQLCDMSRVEQRSETVRRGTKHVYHRDGCSPQL